jgi:hypothetical protein
MYASYDKLFRDRSTGNEVLMVRKIRAIEQPGCSRDRARLKKQGNISNF